MRDALKSAGAMQRESAGGLPEIAGAGKISGADENLRNVQAEIGVNASTWIRKKIAAMYGRYEIKNGGSRLDVRFHIGMWRQSHSTIC
jgi:hypothetical protein